MNCCDQNCHQGRDCPIRALHATHRADQQAEPERIGNDWIDMTMLSVAAALLVFVGFTIGRAWG